MLKGLSLLVALLVLCGVVVAQNSNSSTTTTERPRTTNTNQSKPKPAATPKKQTAPIQESGSEGVLAAFNTLINGIRHASVDEVMSTYWNSAQLNLFNYNGSVTKGWAQVRKNRASSYPEIKDVKLDVRDVSVTMLGPTGAVVTCLWTQSQDYEGAPEAAAGRGARGGGRGGAAGGASRRH